MDHGGLMEWSDAYEAWLFSGPVVVGLCVLWTAAFLVAFAAMPPRTVHASGAPAVSSGGPTEEARCSGRRTLQKKLRRMWLYCAMASASGAAFVVSCFFHEDPVFEMLVAFGPVHQCVFAMAVGHWAVNLWEDWRTRHHVAQGLSADSGGGLALFPLNLCCGPDKIIYTMYVLHHVTSLFAYSFSLATHKLGGVMVQGLLFEVPVLLMLRRELAVSQDDAPRWLQSTRAVHRHWFLTYLMFALGRGPAEILWIVSMTPGYGKERLEQHCGGAVVVVYHALAVFFTSLNIRAIGLFCCWHAQDVAFAEEQKAIGSAWCEDVRIGDSH